MKPVDAHCHIDFDQFKDDREEVIERSKEELEFIVNAGSCVENNEQALKLQEKYPDFVVANLGLHPTYTEKFDQLEEVKEQIRDNDPVAVGEIGLDHHHITDEAVRDRQREVFREMLALAEDLEKPVVVHSRDAEREAVEIISEYDLPGVMLHCFNGSVELATDAVEKGFLIGVTTQVLYSNRVQNIVRDIDVDNLLLETDSPFLYRGDRNEPLNVAESAKKIAEIKELNEEEVIESTTGNARKLFRNG
ncbi:TatD family hydrolase [Candidatus Nanohalovita haloferacivicina]|uniref:TatD family hydrolase n=1 Tax=Candidatus Nanohalovita haloferacivicina TaxID=2978046 RepID=UPI00325FC05B|nr:TatD DNase family protein [Candidatus Nanohalobia archaeon BNXNv]